jgi:hypothetical protein
MWDLPILITLLRLTRPRPQVLNTFVRAERTSNNIFGFLGPMGFDTEGVDRHPWKPVVTCFPSFFLKKKTTGLLASECERSLVRVADLA